jgi:hypothetical protein
MATHKFSGSRGDYSLALCGREVRTNTTTLNIKAVTCKRCLSRWARMLAALPDVFPKAAK